MRLLFSAFLAAATCFAATSVPSLPAWFEPAGEGRYVSRGAGGHLLLEQGSATLSLPGAQQALRLVLQGASPGVVAEALDRLPGRTNYLVGNDRAAWRTGVEQFARVRFHSVYKNIDLIYYAQGREMEYDFVLAPGANPAQIRMRFEGAKSVRVAADGALLLETETHLVRQAPPVVYQETRAGEARRMVAGRYAASGNDVHFVLGSYDRTKALVIDPVLTFVSYFGGDKVDQIKAVAASVSGGVWLTGTTNSSVNLPGYQAQPFMANVQGNFDAFLARVIPSDAIGASVVVNYTFLGGAAKDEASAILVDAKDRVYLTGSTTSTDFPNSSNSVQTTNAGTEDAFLTVLDTSLSDTSALVYSSYFGGAGRDFGAVLTARPNGNILIAGNATSGELPNADASVLQQSNRGGIDGFLAEINTTAGTIVYSTFLGGDGTDNPTGLAVAPNGQVIVTGMTSSTDFPTAGLSYSWSYFGRGDVFVVSLDLTQANTAALINGGYLGGNDLDYPTALLLDVDGTVWIGGYTFSRDLPVTLNAVQTINAGSADLFLMHIDLNRNFGDQLLYCTYFGGSGADVPYSMIFDGANHITLGGYTMSRDFPTAGDVLPAPGSRVSIDGFVTSLDTVKPFLGGIVHSGVLGSPSTDVIVGLSRDAAGQVYFGGYTASASLPVTDGVGKPNAVGLLTGFVGMIKP